MTKNRIHLTEEMIDVVDGSYQDWLVGFGFVVISQDEPHDWDNPNAKFDTRIYTKEDGENLKQQILENQKIVDAMKNTLKDDSMDYWLEKKDWAQDGEELRAIFNELLYGKITTDSQENIKEIQSMEKVEN